jgi:hypothetical protein
MLQPNAPFANFMALNRAALMPITFIWFSTCTFLSGLDSKFIYNACFISEIDCNILLILAFVLIAVIALWVINWVISLFKHHDPCDPCSIVNCDESSCCDFSEEFECDASLLE